MLRIQSLDRKDLQSQLSRCDITYTIGGHTYNSIIWSRKVVHWQLYLEGCTASAQFRINLLILNFHDRLILHLLEHCYKYNKLLRQCQKNWPLPAFNAAYLVNYRCLKNQSINKALGLLFSSKHVFVLFCFSPSMYL